MADLDPKAFGTGMKQRWENPVLVQSPRRDLNEKEKDTERKFDIH